MKREIFKHNGNTLSYLICGNPNSKTVILLPPGIGDSNYFNNLSKTLTTQYQVIAIDFPGINESFFSHNNTIHGISNTVTNLLTTLNITQPIIVGVSCGGNVVIEISYSIQCHKIILLYTGEYWNLMQKLWYSTFFIPAQIFRPVRRFLAKKLTKKRLFDFRQYSDSQLKQFCWRWINILWYTIPNMSQNNVRTTVVCSTTDNVVNRQSMQKIERLFPNQTIVNSTGDHLDCLQKLQNSNFGPLVKHIND